VYETTLSVATLHNFKWVGGWMMNLKGLGSSCGIIEGTVEKHANPSQDSLFSVQD
jgi:hypothetical protein